MPCSSASRASFLERISRRPSLRPSVHTMRYLHKEKEGVWGHTRETEYQAKLRRRRQHALNLLSGGGMLQPKHIGVLTVHRAWQPPG